MKFKFTGDRGDLIGVGAFVRGDIIELDEDVAREHIGRNFPIEPIEEETAQPADEVAHA